MTSSVDIPYSNISIRRGVVYAGLYSFVIPLFLFAPLLIARALNIPLAESIGVTSKNFYFFLIAASMISSVLLCVLITRDLRRSKVSWQEVGIRKFPIFKAALYILAWPIFILLAITVVAVIASVAGLQPPESSGSGSGRFVASLGVAGALILGSLVAPIIEEIIFRGILLSSLTRRYSFIAGLIISSVLFAAFHLNPLQIITTMFLGPYLCVMYRRLGSIVPGIILHSLHNAAVFAVAVTVF